ncbi:hypothetical protein L9F63_021542 [Diploptera punctata]|uniref:Cytochrome b5 domain-containing protein 1 n=1 Tax=Diploptera punctata TaxID=6984 RepID=A0AAD7ZPE1_DIPPU|nr:hypothetical protein L9F63_021542 [Diploptera punctata]
MDNLHYLPAEVAIHNKPEDIWVSFLGKVYDLSMLVDGYEGQDIIKPLLAYAGKDISEWFDPRTRDIQHYIHPITGARIPYTPHGRIPDVGPQVPITAWTPLERLPWWKDPKYLLGNLTEGARTIRVCKEDTLKRIAERIKPFNSHVGSYTFKYNNRVLDMDKTLEENGIGDDRGKFEDVNLPEDDFIPCLMLYFNDDLTVG